MRKNVLCSCLGYIICVMSNWINISYEYFQFLITENLLQVVCLFVHKPSNYSFCIYIMCNVTKHTNSNYLLILHLPKTVETPILPSLFIVCDIEPHTFYIYCILHYVLSCIAIQIEYYVNMRNKWIKVFILSSFRFNHRVFN